MTRDIVINGRFLSRRMTGVERYAGEINRLIGSRCRVERTWVSGFTGHLWEQFVLPSKLRSESALWSPANTGPLMIRNQAVTLHDLSPLEHPEWFRSGFAVWYRLFVPILVKRVAVIFTPSGYVRQKVIDRFKVRNVLVTPNGVDISHFHPGAQQTRYEFPEKFILFVGTLQPRKNLQALLRAWHEIKDEYPYLWLVAAGKAGTIFKKINIHPNERVCFLGYVAEEAMPGLYTKATLVVLPSFDEGFGLPALEAMACGIPVIVSDAGALPETVGDAGLIFKISEPNSLSKTIRECLSNTALRSILIEKGHMRIKNFSWQRSADLIWKTLNEI